MCTSRQPTMLSYDAAIVGGGPAGSSCAAALHRAGLNVVVLDKSEFPRNKVCAGWITPQVIAATHLDVEDYGRRAIFQPIRGFVVAYGRQPEVDVPYGDVVAYGIRRCEFDDYLLRKANVACLLGTPLSSIRRRNGDWLLNEQISAPLVIGAGGHFCPVAKALGADVGRRECPITAQEIEFECEESGPGGCGVSGDTPELYFCEDLKGYGWCFRKGRFVNIGFGREDAAGLAHGTRDFWNWLAEAGKVPAAMRPRFQGHAYLSRTQSTRPIFDTGALLIGDSAGLADPVSGEGIRAAIESGLLAARVVQASGGVYTRDRLSEYGSLVSGHFGAAEPRHSPLIPQSVRTALARLAMRSSWLTRHVILDRGFLHPGQPALHAGSLQ
jgi:geranylgeranyl reductase family protein